MTILLKPVALLPLIFVQLSANTFADANAGQNEMLSRSRSETTQTIIIKQKTASGSAETTSAKDSRSRKPAPDQGNNPRTFKKKKKLATDGIVGP